MAYDFTKRMDEEIRATVGLDTMREISEPVLALLERKAKAFDWLAAKRADTTSYKGGCRVIWWNESEEEWDQETGSTLLEAVEAAMQKPG